LNIERRESDDAVVGGWWLVVEKIEDVLFFCLLNFENVVSTFCVSLSFLSRMDGTNGTNKKQSDCEL